MNKRLVYSIILCIILILCKYFFSNYEISYKVNNYDINVKYSKKRFYYEIKKDNFIYNFDYYKKRTFKKDKISKIDEVNSDTFNCIFFKLKDIDTYPLCYENGIFVDYNSIETDLLDEYKTQKLVIDKTEKDFSYNNNLSKEEYVALWNYKGYIVMNGKEYENINIFDKDRYDNSLSYLYDNTIYMADYNSEYEYKKLYTFNITNKQFDSFDLEYTIDFDSYFVGSIGKNIYLFDNKNSILYELNTKNNKMIIKCNNETGFVKYEKGEFVSCSKTEYKIDKITYDEKKSIYSYELKDKMLYKRINDNNKISQLLFKNEVKIIAEYKNEIYYQQGEKLYKYTPFNGSEEIFYNYELNFNDNNTIFVYHK